MSDSEIPLDRLYDEVVREPPPRAEVHFKYLGHAFFITDPEADGHDWSPWRTRDLNEAPPCDCGAEKSGTTHADWCSRMNDLKE